MVPRSVCSLCGQPKCSHFYPSHSLNQADHLAVPRVTTREPPSPVDTVSLTMWPSPHDFSKASIKGLQINFQSRFLTLIIITEMGASVVNLSHVSSCRVNFYVCEAQEIFYSDPSVLYVSLHAEGDYPCKFFMLTCGVVYEPLPDFTGSTTEKGMDNGVNANINYPLPRGTQDSDYCAALTNAVDDIKRFDPGYLLLRLFALFLSRA